MAANLGTPGTGTREARRTTVDPVDDVDRSTRLAGVGFALLSAAAFGVMPILGKLAYEDGADPVGVLAVRFVVAGFALLALAVGRGEALPRGRTLGALCLLGGVGYVAMSLSYFLALERISAGLTALLLYFYPALVVLLAALVLRQSPRPVAVACVVLATLGTALTVGPVGTGQVAGIALGLGAAAAYALYIVLSSRVLRVAVGPFATAAVILLACGAVFTVLTVVTGARLPEQVDGWLAALGVALFGGVVAVSAFFAALSRLGPSDTAVISTFEPVVSIGVAALVLRERLTPLQGVGGVLVLAAVVTLARLEPRTAPADDEVPA